MDWRRWLAGVALALPACNGTVGVGNSGLSGGGTGTPSDDEGDATTGGIEPDPGTTTSTGGADSESGSSSDGFDTDETKLDLPEVPDPEPPDFPQSCAEAEDAESSVGCTFYPIYLPYVSNGVVGFAAANVSGDTAHVELLDDVGIVDEADVEPGDVHIFTVDTSRRALFGTEIGNAGYELSSDLPLQVFTFMPYSGTLVTNDASIMFPGSTLGTRHRIANFEETGDLFNDQHVTVVATQDDTEVTLTLVNPGAVTEAGPGIPALDYDAGEDTVTVTLNRLEHVVFAAPQWLDGVGPNPVYGSIVESTAPVAVYSGVGGLILNAGANDMVHTAVPPTTALGTSYGAAKFVPVGNAPDVWRFVGNADGTVIDLTGGVEDTIELDAGEVYDIWTSQSFWAEGNEPFGLLHLMTGSVANPPLIPHDCDSPISGPGDPAMGWAFARENWLHRYLMPVGQSSNEPDADQWCHNHLTVVAPIERWEEIEVNGEVLPDSFPIGDSGFGYTYVPTPAGNYELVAPEDVGVQVDVYGYHHNGSYFYPGGMGLKEINPEG